MPEIFKALGDLNRLKIFSLLTVYDLCVCEIEVLLDLSQSNVSRHIAKLRQAKLITGDKEGQWIHYKVSDNIKSDHKLLYEYLLSQFEQANTFIALKRRCQKYKESPYTCQTITTDKPFVMNFLERNKINEE